MTSGKRGPGHQCTAACDHSAEYDQGGSEWSLYSRVDMDNVVCLNETERDSGKNVLRPWDARLDMSLPTLRSDADEELLLSIPFVSAVKIKSICVIGCGGEECPAEMRAYVNMEHLDFSGAASTQPAQKWELVEENPRGEVEYPTRFSRFQNVSRLWLFFPRNFGADVTSIRYIGLKGEYTNYRREAVRAAYELRPLAAPRKIADEAGARMGM